MAKRLCACTATQDVQFPAQITPSTKQVVDIQNQKSSAVEQDQASANEDVFAIGWRWRQPFHKLHGRGIDMIAKARRKRAAHAKLPFKAGGQAVPLRQTGREVVLMLAVPQADLVVIVARISVLVLFLFAFAPDLFVNF